MNNIIDKYIDKYIDIPKKINDKLVYKSGMMRSPLLNNIQIPIIYADYTASGRPSPIIEEFLQKTIYPKYSNTHSNASNGILMKTIIADTKDYIRKQLNISSDYQIIFSGNGTTGAINQLINCIDYTLYDNVIIYLSLYEHYSNHVPWIELIHPNKKIIYIPFVEDSDMIDISFLDCSINEIYNNLLTNQQTLIICSISACSNINGKITDSKSIKRILNKYQKTDYFNIYYFADYACSAPYVNIDGSIYDAFFFSPHKFIGGVSTPGILISKSCLFMKSKPYCVGGGCVKKASLTNVEYDSNLEKKESAGTPNIIGIIKIKNILKLKNTFKSVISTNEHIIYQLIIYKINNFKETYPNFKPILYTTNKHLPILSFAIDNLHYNFIVVLLNDKFGIQTRGGIGCCGLLAEYIETKYNIRGWCRISFHWLMPMKTILYIFDALEYIIRNGHDYLQYYTYDSEQNLYYFKRLID